MKPEKQFDRLHGVREGIGKAVRWVSHEAIEKHWPTVQRVFRETVAAAALAVARDDEKPRSI